MESNEKKTRKKLNKVHVTIIVTVLVLTVPRVITAFPRVWHDGMGIRVFSIDRMVRENLFARMDSFEGRVLGNHVLETEHGEIRLGRGSLVGVFELGLGGIRDESFRRRRASHNLVVEGIAMPQNIRVAFDKSRITLLALDRQEIIIADVPLGVLLVSLLHNAEPADISMGVESAPEYIILSDYTQVRFDLRGLARLSMHKGEGTWELRNVHFSVPVMRLGETEFTRYRSITFRANWGEFIEGELFE